MFNNPREVQLEAEVIPLLYIAAVQLCSLPELTLQIGQLISQAALFLVRLTVLSSPLTC